MSLVPIGQGYEVRWNTTTQQYHVVQSNGDGSVTDLGAIESLTSLVSTGGTAIDPATEPKQDAIIADTGAIQIATEGSQTVLEDAVDGVTTALRVVDYSHHEMHGGSFYFIKTFVENTGAVDTFDTFAFTTPNTATRIHARARLSADADIEIEIQEGAVVTGGTPVVGRNCDRDQGNGAALSAVAAPTISTPGTVIWTSRTGGGRNPTGVAPEFGYEIIAKTDTVYAFKITKRTSADTITDIDFFWYEHAPV